MFDALIEKIITLKRPEVIKINDRQYRIDGYKPVTDPYPDHLNINNLTGIVDFVNGKPETWDNMFIHVKEFNDVILYQSKCGDFNQREKIISASSRDCEFRFGREMNVENFIISLNGMFIPGEDRDYILKFVSGVKIDANAKLEDDGISQTVTARHGVSSLVKDIPIKNIVSLVPFRTFGEITQPESEFVFRLKLNKDEATCALHECDGAAWKQTAIQSIRSFLAAQLPGMAIIA